jgi:hypothetical protein
MTAPHSLGTIKLFAPQAQTPMLVKRHGQFAKGDILPETQVQHSPRRKVSDFPDGFLKRNQIEAMEQNQKIAPCCRHPENHEVEALKSHPDEEAPDIYVYHCTCGKKHRFFCVGMSDERPEWR